MKKWLSGLLALALVLSLASMGLAKGLSDDPAAPLGKYAEPVVVKMCLGTNMAMVFPEGDSYENNVWTRSLLEDLNIQVEYAWTAVAGDKYDTKLNLAIATNDLPDIFATSNYTQFNQMVKGGLIQDLGAVYDQYVSDQVRGYMSQDGGKSMGWGNIGGVQYGLPKDGVDLQSPYFVYIRDDFAQEMGLTEAPATMDQVVELAKAYAAKAEGNFAFALGSGIYTDGFANIAGLCNAYGAYPEAWLEDENGKLVYGTIQPEMKDALAVYADLYKNGYIDPAFASYDGNKIAEQMTSGKVGVIIGRSWVLGWPLEAMYETDGVTWSVYPLVKFESNPNEIKLQTSDVKAAMDVVRAGYEHPEALLKIINYEAMKVNDPELAEPDKFHSDENYGYHMMAPIYPIKSDTLINLNTSVHVTQAIDNNDEAYLITPHDKKQYPNVKAYFDTQKAGGEQQIAYINGYKSWYGEGSIFGILNQYYYGDKLLTSKLTGIETPEMSRSKANLDMFVKQALAEFITGVRPIDQFDAFVDEWRAMGGSIIEDELNEWYQSTK
ncbi:MAG: extracellular solute-binding protein [Clostridiales bacterium]|nr:extracellular solute-binding protein [Clostridiales bacterium]